MSRIHDAERELCLERADGYCEACARPVSYERGSHAFHHRYERGMGGAANRLPFIDLAVNLMVVHPDCHNLASWSIHSRVARSERLFHIVRSDPRDLPRPLAIPNLRLIAA